MAHGPDQDGHRTATTNWALAIILCGLGLSCYANSFDGPFIFDDHGNIVGNPALASLWPETGESRLVSRRPIGHLSFALNYAASGLEPRSYHAVNVAIHIGAALVLFDLVRRTLLLPSLAHRYRSSAPFLAFAVAAIWLVHPLQTSAVTYVIQRLESLMGLFYLLCLYGILRGSQARRGWAWYVLAVAALWLGMGTKEVMATAPVAALLYDRIFLAESWRSLIRHRWGVYLGFVPPMIWLALAVAPAFSSGSPSNAGLGVASVTPLEYLCSQPGVLLHYLRLVFWPDPLCLDYAWPVARWPAQVVWPGLVILLLVLASLVALVRGPRIGLVAVLFFLILAPTSSVMPIKDLAFEHRMYLALAPLIVLVVIGAERAIDELVKRWPRPQGSAKRQALRWEMRSAQLQRAAGLGLLAITIAGLGFLTHARNQDYASEESIWKDTVRKRPKNARAYVNLGNVYLGQRNYDAAIACYTSAIRVKPDDATAYNNRGRVYSDVKQFEDALNDFNQSIRIDPQYHKAYHNRGNVYLELGEYQKAIADHTKALEVEPDAADSFFSRGNSYFQLHEWEKALADYTAAIRLASHFPDALVNRGSTYLKFGRYYEAIEDFTAALEQQPGLAAAYNNRALGFYYQRQYDRAWQDVQRLRAMGQAVHPKLLELLTAATGPVEEAN